MRMGSNRDWSCLYTEVGLRGERGEGEESTEGGGAELEEREME